MQRVVFLCLCWVLMAPALVTYGTASDGNPFDRNDGGVNTPAVPLPPEEEAGRDSIMGAMRADAARSIREAQATWAAFQHRWAPDMWPAVRGGLEGLQRFFNDLAQLPQQVILAFIAFRCGSVNF